MSMLASTRLRRAALVLAGAALPTSALAETCSELEAKRNAAIAVVTAQTHGLRECLIAFPNWREEARERYYDAYDVTETIPGQPRRLIISHGRYSSTAYVAPATKTRVERSVEYEDIGPEKRLSLYTADERASLYALGPNMKVALADEMLLCKGKVDPVALTQGLVALGWGFKGGLEVVQVAQGGDAPLSASSLEQCRINEQWKQQQAEAAAQRRAKQLELWERINQKRAARGLPPLPMPEW